MKSRYIDASPNSNRRRNDGGPPIARRKAIPVQVINNPAMTSGSFQPQNLGLIMRGAHIVGKVVLEYAPEVNSTEKVAYYTDGRTVRGYRGPFKTESQARDLINNNLNSIPSVSPVITQRNRSGIPQTSPVMETTQDEEVVNTEETNTQQTIQSSPRESRDSRLDLYRDALHTLGYLDFL